MSTADLILFSGPTTWRIARVDRANAIDWSEVAVADLGPADVATRVADALAAVGSAGAPVTLAIASADCLAASIVTDGLPRGDRKAMLYRFEDKLPIAAEDVVADFVPNVGGRALGVCAMLDRVRPTVDALEAAGVPVRSIVPAALAAAQALTHGDGTLLIGDAAMLSAIAIRDGVPVDWALLPADAADVRLHLAMLGDAPARLIACGVDASLVAALSAETIDRSPEDAAAEWCARVANGGDVPWVEFRLDALAAADRLRQFRRPMNALLAAATVTLAVTAAALFVRSARYARLDADCRARTTAAFHEQFPDWAVPTNVRAVVDAEHRRVSAATNGAERTRTAARASGAWYGSAFAVMRDVLVALPADGGFAMERMSFQDASFELAGRLRAYDAVDAIATAARRSGMDVAPPQARREAGGTWTFVVQGTRPSSIAPGEKR